MKNDELLQIIRSLGLQLYNRAGVANPGPPYPLQKNEPAWAGFKTPKEGRAKINWRVGVGVGGDNFKDCYFTTPTIIYQKKDITL